MAVASETIPEPPVRWAWLGLRVLFGVLLVWFVVNATKIVLSPDIGPWQTLGDYRTYMDATHRWLAGGSFYQPYQLAGPYTVAVVEILYPPVILPLLVPFAFLPAVAWWIVPMAITGAVLAYWRPSLLGWTLILACLALPMSFYTFAWGNPAMWTLAFVALGTVYHWPSVFVLLKPTLAPFALVGIRHHSWWVALGVLVVASVAFLPMWLDYLTVTLNARGPLVGPLYSLPQVPLMLIPLIARWQTQRTPTPERAGAVVSASKATPAGS